ncbi:hypothetical protein U9M48_027051 [Paspalum notatum var. saurae]|uniref:Uncharacterized protein n=1 Tax=Paspalum notatum var. saurae TaxID=547442 RepID=A0AAQ3TWK2_PASNO
MTASSLGPNTPAQPHLRPPPRAVRLCREEEEDDDHGIEEPTQDLPLIEKPDDKWNPEQEDGVSLSWPSL